MVHLLCAVKDIKSNNFNRPFPEINRVNAVRGLSIVVNDPNTQLHHFPQDFELFQIGTFDDETGKLESSIQFIESALTLSKLSKEIDNVAAKIDNGTNKNVK